MSEMPEREKSADVSIRIENHEAMKRLGIELSEFLIRAVLHMEKAASESVRSSRAICQWASIGSTAIGRLLSQKL